MTQETSPQEIALHACTCQQDRGISSLPAEGQQVRVTLQKEMQMWEGNKRIVMPVGTIYEGVAAAVEAEGFFDVVGNADQRRKFFINDSSIKVEVVA